MSNFDAQLGNPQAAGLLPVQTRISRIRRGENPYHAGNALPPNSPVFFGREEIHHNICARLLSPDKPQSVSLLGERRIGKSSLLNQVYQALAVEPNLLVLKTTAQGFSNGEQADFFGCLHAAMCQGLGLTPVNPVSDFAGLRDFIEVQAGKNYRFVVILDEFERLAGNSHFNSDFFANLRTLGYESKYCLGWLTASREPLEKLCREHSIEESSFWNIFICHELGLLSAKEAKDLIRVPALLSLERAPDIEQVLLLAGAHPAFIQIALSGLWENIKHDRQPDWREIRRQLRPHCEKLWHDCSPAEQKILLEIRAGRVPADKTALEDLQVRGLLDEQGHLFSALFAELLPAWQPKEPGKSLQAGIANAEQATEQVSKLHKVYNSFRKIIRELRTDWQGKPDKPEHEDDKEDRI